MGRRLAPRQSRFRCWFRGLWPDRNPLRRASDRAEAAVVAGLAAALLAGVPLAGFAVGQWSYDASVRAMNAQMAWRQVSAVLLIDAKMAPAGLGFSLLRRVPASWTAPDGAQRTGPVLAAATATSGTVLKVWVDASGRLTPMPLQYRQVERQAALAAVLAAAGLGAVLLAVAALARRLLDHRRLAAWDHAWQEAGPRWTIQR